MAIGGSGKNVFESRKLQKRQQVRRQAQARRMLLESLETRQLMAFGPQLIGIQPNEGSLLENGQTRNVAPRELVLRFDDQVALDASTLSGIQLVRSGGDGFFERSTVSSDLGTNNGVVLSFTAAVAGVSGNGIQVIFKSVNRTNSSAATVSVVDRTITLELNNNTLLTSTAQDVINAIDSSAAARQLLSVTRLRGSALTPVGGTATGASPLTLAGANVAGTVTNLNAGTNLQVQILAQQTGTAGRNVQVQVTTRDRGVGVAPGVTVNGTVVSVELNSNISTPTTATGFINAINSSAQAATLIQARLVSGTGTTVVGNRAITYSPLLLTGGSDIPITPAYIGLGSTDREVVLRFGETLPDDLYRLEILGNGSSALRNARGEAFNSGVSRSIEFNLDLGAQVQAIVPQPVTRDPATNRLSQERNRIDVYFNDDDLNTALATNVNFYQLVYTSGTGTNADDVVFVPTRVEYNAANDRASLFFARNLDRLVHPITGADLPISELRLRIGSNESVPTAPTALTPAADAGSSITTSLDVSGSWTPSAAASASLQISSEIRNATPYVLDFPGGNDEPGNRDIRPQTHLLNSADTVDGITTFTYNFQPVLGQINGTLMVNAITEQQKIRTREALELMSQYLGVRFVETENLGLTLAVGDLRAVDGLSLNSPNGQLGVAGQLRSSGQSAAVLDIQDFGSSLVNEFGGDFFLKMMQSVGFLLGLGSADELPALTVQSNVVAAAGTEMVFPGDHDIVHGRYLYRPDSTDIDLYKFTLPVSGKVTVEAFAERLANSSLLDTQLRLYQLQSDGSYREVAQNDDYFSEDSYLALELAAGTYVLGVSASGNNDYNPAIADTGIGGTSEGNYQVRIDFRPPASAVLRDSTGVALDGDADGVPGGVHNFWFRPTGPNNTLYVDKAAAAGGNGTLITPFRNISDAINEANRLGTLIEAIRVVGNGGADGKMETSADNLAYEIGFNALNQPLPDGTTLDVPKDVALMIDAGAVLKLRRARVGVGSTSVSVDRSGSSLQVLGTPRLLSSTGAVLVDSVGLPVAGSVYFTSLHDKAIGKDTNADRFPPPVAAGDWGGIDFRNKVDSTDASRNNLEREALFLNSLTYADIRYGGGQVVVDGNSQVIAPVSMVDSRPTVAFSSISRSADAAMSATPNSFLESNFQDPQSQVTGLYSSDVRRVGPAIVGNRLSNNSINGLFVKVSTGQQTTQTESLTVAARFDDTDIVHVLTENLTIAGTPGGAVLNGTSPSTTLVVLAGQSGGSLAAGTYRYRLTFVDAAGNESLVSEATQAYTLGAGEARISITNLPTVPSGSGFVSRRLYRSDNTGTGNYALAAILNANATSYVDSGSTIGGALPTTTTNLRGRFDASLNIDPGTVVKLQGSRIEVGIGAQLIAEGRDGYSVVFTSLDDVRYGGSGTFSTITRNTARTPVAGDWGGIVATQASSLSIDHANIAFGGGTTRIEGGFAGFNAIEIHQAEARITNSNLENNAVGTLGTTDTDRAGRGVNSDATIFVRGAQPIIIGNTITDGTGPAISINANALNSDIVRDSGRSTGGLDANSQYRDNQGALVRSNRLGDNAINGMVVRGQELTTQSVWDDTDIVHVLQSEVLVTNLHAFGGLRLESSPKASLVVKLQGANAGFTASGTELDIDDRIGGSVQLVGQPGFPVILTSMADDSVGAGFDPQGAAQNDTDNNGSSGSGINRLPTGPEVNNGTLIDNDVNPFTPGAFGFRAGAGGQSGYATIDGAGGGITAAGNAQPFVNTDVIFEFLNYVDIGANGAALNLANTTITTPPTLVAPDLVISAGTFTGSNGNAIRWTVESRMDNGISIVYNTLILESDSGLGDLTFINYLDEDILGASDDLMYITGTPGADDYRVYTLDGPERIGFNQGGFFNAGDNLQNATYLGWAADEFSDLRTAITGTGTTYTLAGNIDTTDLTPFNDPTLGTVFGLADITTAFAWRVDPTARSARMTSFLELVPRDPSTGGQSGDWRSVRLETLSNDRNVQAVTETEASTVAAPGPNGAPNSAQYLGRLAANLISGDENQRLGFEVHGVLGESRDLDVYSFSGKAGTEVWLDIDRTSSALDTVLELVDANGNILALSNNSYAEELGTSQLYRSSSMPANSVQPLRKSPLALYPTSAQAEAKDLYSTNTRDAGMRLVLPGQPGTENVYHVRVRSSSLSSGGPTGDLLTSSSLTGGLTDGNYQLQIRLREVDEFPGSSINYADIRFATTGVEVLGLPRHSPLVGELGEVENGQNPTTTNAQNLGNLLSTDRQAISVAGDLNSAADVDWYQFDLTYQSISPTGLIEYFSTIFDIDYADGLGRPNTSMYIFDSQGRLILSGLNSNVADDRGTSLSDLDGGSAGTQDPYIGTVELQQGQYFLAISNTSRRPTVLDSALVRLQPVSGTRLIARDHVDNPALFPAETPLVSDLFNSTTSIVPYSLGDVVMYVSQDVGFQVTNMYMVNPFTGSVTNTVGRFNFDVQDIAMRFNGTLRAYDIPFTNANVDLDTLADYIDINPGTAAAADIGDLGIQTFRTDAAGAVQDANVGIFVEAITFTEIGGQERGYLVGNRPVTPGPAYFSNILYEFDENSGAATGAPAANRADTARVQGAGTDIRERGYIETNPVGLSVSRQMETAEATRVDPDGSTTTLIADGRRFQIATPSGTNLTFEMNTGPEYTFTYDPASGRNVRDGDRFEVNGQIYEFDTGPVVVINAATGAALGAGSTVRIVDNFNVIRTFEFTQTGATSSGNIPVLFTNGQTQTELVASLINAINAQTGFATKASTVVGGNRISLTNTSTSATALVTGTGLAVSGAPGNSVGLSIPIEENATTIQFIDAIQRAVGSNITVSLDGDRLNLAGATSALVTDLVNRGILAARGGNSSVSGSSIGVSFLASDDAADIAARIARAITGAGVVGLSATTNGTQVVVTGGNFVNADTPFSLAGVAPGGTVTGIAVISGTLFAVSDRGGLYRVASPTGVTNGNIATYVSSASDLLGIQFSSLTAGPVRLSSGDYAEVLFGTDNGGRIYAFDTDGNLLPVFAGGATSVATGLFNLNGVTFAPLDYNLWHESNNRANDAGHGLSALPDGTRNAVPGRSSYYFGFESPGANNVSYTTVSNPGFTNSYNFAGGAQGVMVSNPFDLSGIGTDDQPTLYFNYFLATENANSDLNDLDPMLDAFRVYAGGDDGVWHLLTTNNSERGQGTFDDELDTPSSQETFDNTGVWRQARVNLGNFAGQENVRLRIEFSTAGSFGYGAQGGRGPEIRLLAGDKLRDGQVVTVDGIDFEIEMGTTLVIPAGSALVDGDSITIDGQRFVFDLNGSGVSSPDIAVPYTATETSDVITQRLLTLVEANYAAKTSITGLNFSAESNDTLTTSTRTTISGDSIVVSGNGNIGDNPLLVTSPSADIDLVRIQLSYGATVTVAATATGALTLNPMVRIFDASGVEIAANDNFGGGLNARVTFTAPADGLYYIGVSGSGNSGYNPAVFGTGVASSSGDYRLDIDVTRLLDAEAVGNRLQLMGAMNVSVSPGSAIVVEGGLGTTGLPVFIKSTMTATEVGQALRQTIANALAGGATGVMNIYADAMDMTGFNISSSGPFGLTSFLFGDQFGGYNTSTQFDGSRNAQFPGALRAQNNNFEGVYVDDFIIGTIERGETIINSTADTSFTASNPVGNDILVGPYQLEIRGGSSRGISIGATTPSFVYTEIYEPNERSAPGTSITFNSAISLIDGSTFSLSDGINTVVFEFEDEVVGNGVTAGRIPVPYNAMFNSVTNTNSPETSAVIAARIRDLINGQLVQSLIKVKANLSNGDSIGATSNTIDLFGTVTALVPVEVGTATVFTDSGDKNRERDQGQVVIQNSRITDSSGFGIEIDTSSRTTGTNASNPGTPRNTVVQNSLRQIPGVVVMNNELVANRNGGVRMVGTTNTAGNPSASVPVARVVNNTIIGGRITAPTAPASGTFGGQFFAQGSVAFADAVTSYDPNFSGGPVPITNLQVPSAALGIPDYAGTGEPVGNDNVVSLGRGGRLVVQFTNNRLTGSGDSKPDLMIFEVGTSELVTVEVSTDGITYTNVGLVSGAFPTVDLDLYGFNASSRLQFVRLTDVVTDGSTTGNSVGADIDAVGAISSVQLDTYSASGSGLVVQNEISPTLLNNVLVNNTNGISFVNTTVNNTVLGGTVYQLNTNNLSGSTNLGQFPTVVTATTPMFVNAGTRNFYPAANSPLVDTAVDSLQDRPNMVAVKQGLGIPASPVLAPDYDRNGLLRVNSSSGGGVGNNVFKDRGSLDRADSVRPSVTLLNPQDNDAAGLDSNSETTVVELTNITMNFFDIQLYDGSGLADGNRGSNIDDSTVTSHSFVLYKDRQPLVEGIDYRFGYDTTNNVIRLTPLAGVWELDAVYQIRFLNSAQTVIQAQPAVSYSDATKIVVVGSDGTSKTLEIDMGLIVTIPSTSTGTASVSDGQVIVLDDGTRRLTFELDSNSSITSGNIRVAFTSTSTAEDVAQALSNAIGSNGQTFTRVALGAGRLQLHSANPSFASTTGSITLSGATGVTPNFGLRIPLAGGVPINLNDGETFVISRGSQSVTFELDYNNSVAAGNRAVRLAIGQSAATVGAALVTAIANAGLGLSPVYTGAGLVELGNQSDLLLNLSLTDLTQAGQPGVAGSIRVPLNATAANDAAAVAGILATAINNAAVPGVTASAIGSQVLVEGATGVVGSSTTGANPIKDLAGNTLSPNQTTGQTTLTIFLGQGFDYGDAPDPTYATLGDNNGARHTVVTGYSLGSLVNADADARVVDADNDDGVTITAAPGSGFSTPTAGFSTRIVVTAQGITASRPGLLNAWIDFNGNGTFDSTEKIFNNVSLVNGANTFNITIPSSAATGETWSRFRLSSTGTTDPFGAAADGEVEDYKLRISSNPYQNSTNRFDVSGDGFVSAIDALQLINFLNLNGPRALPLPVGMVAPRFPDVDGNGFINALDALGVINYLNSRPAGEGEGAEGEGDLSEMYGLSSLMAGASLSSTPATNASARNYTELRLGDYLHLSHAVPGPVTSAAAWWDETEMASENLIDELAGAYASEFADSHDELFANLDLEL
jgi:hypothetical protein